jgi:hypothetical protein
MKVKFFQFIPRPHFLLLGLFLLLVSLIGLFHQKILQNDVYRNFYIQNEYINLHEITINVPIDKSTIKKTVCNVRVESGLWEIFLLTHPNKTNELVIAFNKKNVLRHMCEAIEKDDFSLLSLNFYNGMIVVHSKDKSSPFPSRNFSLSKPIEISGICNVTHVYSYKKIAFLSFVLLGLSVTCCIIAVIPKFSEYRLKNKKLSQIGLACIAGELFALLICFYNIFNGKNFYPYNTFLFRPETIAGDLFQTLLPVRYMFLPYGWPEAGNYFPFTYSFLAMLPLYNFQACTALLYALFAFVSAVFAFKIVRPNNLLECILTLFLAWGTLPSLFLWVSGNLEMLIFVVVVGFIFFQRRHPQIAAFLLAFAINIKLYPGVLGVIFLKKKWFKYAFLCFSFTVLLLIFALISQEWNIEKPLICFQFFSDRYSVFINDGLIFSHSLFSLFRYIGCHCFGLTGNGIKIALPYYSIFCVLSFIIVVWNILKYHYFFWEILFLLTGVAVFFPYISFDHTLVLLLPSLWFFIKKPSTGKFDNLYKVCWVLILIPENWHYSSLWPELQISVLIKPIALLFMIITILVVGQNRNKRKLGTTL